jgi:hypothetical protein
LSSSKDTGRRTKGTTACCSPQNNLSIRASYAFLAAAQHFFYFFSRSGSALGIGSTVIPEGGMEIASPAKIADFQSSARFV